MQHPKVFARIEEQRNKFVVACATALAGTLALAGTFHRRWSMQGRIFMVAPLVGVAEKALLKEKHWMKLLLAPARCDTTRVP